MSDLIKVVIVDDHNSMRNSLEVELSAKNGFGVVASADCADAGVAGENIFPGPRTIPMPEGEARFTTREMIVLNLLCRNKKASGIATELLISDFTVKRHIRNILEKSNFPTIKDLVHYIVSNGWINPNL